MNLLEHEMSVARLFNHPRRPVNVCRRLFTRHTIKIRHRDQIAFKCTDFSVVEKNDLPRIRKDRQNIRGNEEFPLTDSNHERTPSTCCHQHSGSFLAQHEDGIAPRNLPEPSSDRFLKRMPFRHPTVNEMRDNLRISVRLKRIPIIDKTPLQFNVVFNDAVMDENKMTGPMRMGVVFCGFPMRRPTCMPNTYST